MEFIYGQDCGGYEITFDPDLPFLNQVISGVGLDP